MKHGGFCVPGRGHTSGVKPVSNEPDAGQVETPLDGPLREGALLNRRLRKNHARLDAEADEHWHDGLFQIDG